MSSDYSLVGYESVPVAEYMPILQKIIDDLHIIYDSGISKSNNLSTNILNHSIMEQRTLEKSAMSITSVPARIAEIETAETQTESENQSHEFRTPQQSFSVNVQTEEETRYLDDTDGAALDSSLRFEIQNLKEALSEKNHDIEQLKIELAKCTKENDSLEVKFSGMSETVEDQNRTIQKLNETIKNQIIQLTEKEESFRILQDEVHRESKNEDELSQSYAVLLNNIRKKKEEIWERDNKILELENEYEEFKTKCRKFEKINKTLTKDCETYKQELEECEKQRDEYIDKFKSLTKEIKKMKQSSVDEAEIQKYKKELKDLKDQLKKKDNELKESGNHVAELKQTSESYLKTIQSSKPKLNELEKSKLKVTELTKELEDKTKKYTELQNDCAKKQQAMAVMRDKIRVKGESDPQESKKLNFQVKALEMEVDQLHNKIENLNLAYEDKSKDFDLATKQNQNLLGEVANLKKLFNSKEQATMNRETLIQPERPENDFPGWWKNHMGNR